MLWTALVTLFVSGGATCANRQTIPDFAPPVVFEAAPSFEEIVQRINRSYNITRLESYDLTVSGPELAVKLRGQIKWERPHNFLFEAYAGSKLLGTALAAGSNSEMFWLKSQYPPPPVLWVAGHDEFERQQGPRQILPVSPLWLREALGVIELDPNFVHQEPIVRPDGKLEIRSMIPSPRGAYRRDIVVDPKTAVIEQTVLSNHLGVKVAVAHQSEHVYSSVVDYSLPHRIDIQLLPEEGPGKLMFTVEVGNYMLNQADGSSVDAFVPPDATGLTVRNLTQVNSGAASVQSPGYTAAGPQPLALPGDRARGSLLGTPRSNAWQQPGASSRRSLFP